MNNNISRYPGTWCSFSNEFKYKLMKYQNSCFPCSLHTILANLGYSADGNDIEDAWNQMHPGGLDQSAPQLMQVHQYLSDTQEMGCCHHAKLFTQQHFATLNDAATIAADVAARFINVSGPAGMIAGIGHAEVFFRTANNKFFHYCPGTDAGTAYCHEIVITGIQAVTNANGEYAILLNFNHGTQAETHAADCVMLID